MVLNFRHWIAIWLFGLAGGMELGFSFLEKAGDYGILKHIPGFSP